MRHEMKLAKEPFDKISSGTKTVEARLYDDKRRAIALGDEIVFRLVGDGLADDPVRTVTKRVTALHIYPDFEAMMYDLPVNRFGWNTPEQAVKEIGRFYTLEDQERSGVVGIFFSFVFKVA